MSSGAIFCSTIIPTIGRTTLTRAVNSVLSQVLTTDNFELGDFEIIVVNDSGKPLPEMAWQTSPRVKIIHTNGRERSVARNTGAALARGAYLHFLDDDDWMLPGALESLRMLASAHPQAAWLYGAAQVVDRADKLLIQLHYNLRGNCFVQTMAGEWIPLMASLIKVADFFAIGGFNPLVTNAEDIDLLRRIALRGDIMGTSTLVTCIGLGAENSTTEHGRHTEFSRWAREKILNEPGAFTRLYASADNSLWVGRLVRIYLTSVLWNLQHKNFATAVERTALGLAGILAANRHLGSPDFWRALGSRYESDTFQRGFAAGSATGSVNDKTSYSGAI
ncbi:MAG: glycosyltransferase family A protein [Chloroflexi bacterium]|nr:glycosyltransferase family A protein [Chloroflexota bacterium]